jgi:hypothetical protein
MVYLAHLKNVASILLGLVLVLDTKQGEHSVGKLADRHIARSIHCRILGDIEGLVLDSMLQTR